MKLLQLPPYPVFPELHNDVAGLRAILESDMETLTEISFYDGQPAGNAVEAWRIQQRIDADYARGESIHWGITDRQTGELVGTCGYYRGLANGTGELGCVLKPAFRGRGYMTAALALAIDFGIKQAGLSTIMAITTPGNRAAVQLLGRLQFVKIKDLPGGQVYYEWLRTGV
jgi:ribosomal-protein-alanine N-acetyltransferase